MRQTASVMVSAEEPEATLVSMLCERVKGDYLEMPGLALSVSQGARLWNLDPSTSRWVLDALVASGFLRQSGHRYLRAESGHR